MSIVSLFPQDSVPSTRKINNKNLSSDIILTASDVEAAALSDKVSTIDENSTDIQYPSAKAVWDLVSGTVGLCLPAKKPLEDMTWEDISTVAKAGMGSMYFQVGDIKSIQFNGSEYYVQIIGFNHDDVVDSSTYGRTKAGITFQFGVAGDSSKAGLYTSYFMMNPSSVGNSGGWSGSQMCKTTMPRMKGYLPEDLQSVIIKVNKLTNAGSKSTMIDTSQDDLWLLSEVEIFGNEIEYSAPGEGSQYQFYKNGNSRKRYPIGSASGKPWWERSPCFSSTGNFCCVGYNGNVDWNFSETSSGVSFGFCL